MHPQTEKEDKGWEVFLSDSLSPRTHRQKVLLMVVAAYTLLAAAFDEQPLSLLHLGGVGREPALGAIATVLLYLSVSYAFYLRQDLLSWYAVKTALVGSRAHDALGAIATAEESIISAREGCVEAVKQWEGKMQEIRDQLSFQLDNCKAKAAGSPNPALDQISKNVEKYIEMAERQKLNSMPEQWRKNFAIQEKIIRGASDTIAEAVSSLRALDRDTRQQRLGKWAGIIIFEVAVPLVLAVLALSKTASFMPELLRRVLFG